jgi:carboxylesterase type B
VEDPNLAVQDVVLGLESIRQRIGAFGGDSGQVTIGGQSSGGTMVRGKFSVDPAFVTERVALLANRRAIGLFRAVIIQSDPMVSPGQACLSSLAELWVCQARDDQGSAECFLCFAAI